MTNTDIAKIAKPVTLNVDLPALAKAINDNHTAIIREAKSAVGKAIAAGEALSAAKAVIPDGTWLRWLKGNCIISDRTAKLYMQLAENKLVLETWLRDGTQQLADQTLNGALKMLRGPSNKPPSPSKDRAQKLTDDLLQTLVNLQPEVASQRAHRLVERLQEERLID
jgi:hypothetical protein